MQQLLASSTAVHLCSHAFCSMAPYMHHTIPTDTLPLAGTLPESWADPGSFPALTSLTLDLSNLSGTLPPCWGNNGSFPVLDSLALGPLLSPGVAPLAGTLPKAWSSPTAFPMLTSLSITNLSITGGFFLLFSHDGPIVQGVSQWLPASPAEAQALPREGALAIVWAWVGFCRLLSCSDCEAALLHACHINMEPCLVGLLLQALQLLHCMLRGHTHNDWQTAWQQLVKAPFAGMPAHAQKVQVVSGMRFVHTQS